MRRYQKTVVMTAHCPQGARLAMPFDDQAFNRAYHRPQARCFSTDAYPPRWPFSGSQHCGFRLGTKVELTKPQTFMDRSNLTYIRNTRDISSVFIYHSIIIQTLSSSHIFISKLPRFLLSSRPAMIPARILRLSRCFVS